MKKLKKQEAFTLLRNLENNNYKLTDKDNRIINHNSFRKYRSEHVKRLVNGSFNRAIRALLDNRRLTYEDFTEITKPTSKWYRKKFIDSFFFHCTNPNGQFYEQCKGKNLTRNVIVRDNGQSIKCLICN